MDEHKIDPLILTVNPSELDLKIDGKNGVRIVSNGLARNTSIEIKDGGAWKRLDYVQRIEVIIDCQDDGGLPKVKITYLVIPESKCLDPDNCPSCSSDNPYRS